MHGVKHGGVCGVKQGGVYGLSKMVCMGLSKVVFCVYGVKQSHWGCFRILHWAHFEV